MTAPSRLLIDSILQRFRAQKQTAEKAVVQISDALLHQALDENTNSLAVIMKHMAGNMESRFTDFLTSDGEKPTRDRDDEFVDTIVDRAAVMARWERGWGCLFAAVEPLTDADLARTVTIRQQPHSVADALVRALDHLGYHTGQIVQLARYLAKDKWQTLTIPRGGSRQFNQAMQQKFSK
jgi:uncharacterized damage-inducible protein DinB